VDLAAKTSSYQWRKRSSAGAEISKSHYQPQLVKAAPVREAAQLMWGAGGLKGTWGEEWRSACRRKLRLVRSQPEEESGLLKAEGMAKRKIKGRERESERTGISEMSGVYNVNWHGYNKACNKWAKAGWLSLIRGEQRCSALKETKHLQSASKKADMEETSSKKQ